MDRSYLQGRNDEESHESEERTVYRGTSQDGAGVFGSRPPSPQCGVDISSLRPLVQDPQPVVGGDQRLSPLRRSDSDYNLWFGESLDLHEDVRRPRAARNDAVSKSRRAESPKPNVSSGRGGGICSNCGVKHRGECRAPIGGWKERTCFTCGRPGHKADACKEVDRISEAPGSGRVAEIATDPSRAAHDLVAEVKKLKELLRAAEGKKELEKEEREKKAAEKVKKDLEIRMHRAAIRRKTEALDIRVMENKNSLYTFTKSVGDFIGYQFTEEERDYDLHYQFEHWDEDDLDFDSRPDAMAFQDVRKTTGVHDSAVAVIGITRTSYGYLWNSEQYEQIRVSAEAIAQLSAPSILGVHYSSEQVLERLRYASRTLFSVNDERSRYISGEFPVSNAVFVAYAIHLQERERLARVCPLPDGGHLNL
jgi:hypothetical protein